MVDQIVTDAKAVAADAKAEGSKIWAWIKDKWPHAVTWLGLIYTFLKAHV